MTGRRDSYIIASIAVAMTGAFCYLFFGVQQHKLSELRTSIGALEDQLARRTGDIAELSQIQANLKRANDWLADYSLRIPETAEVGNFVEEVSAIAERLGLRNQSVVPRSPEVRGAVTVLPIKISFQAPLGAMFDFLREIERLPRVARVTKLAVEQTEPDEEPVYRRAGELRTELTAQIYYEANRAGSRT